MKMMKTLKLLSGVGIPSAKTYRRTAPLAPAIFTQLACASFLARLSETAEAAPALLSSPARCSRRNADPGCAPRKDSQVMIYVVDDEEGLTELYTHFLKGTGYGVRAFNRRAKALKALIEDRMRPDLLISDYVGDSMSVDRFMQCCRVVHPALRILMASGFSERDVRFSGSKPDRFIQKPFTAEEFLREVSAALIA
jgi:CheY-like chemotaxis protein